MMQTDDTENSPKMINFLMLRCNTNSDVLKTIERNRFFYLLLFWRLNQEIYLIEAHLFLCYLQGS